SSNEKAKRELGWTPRWTWREGFRHGLSEPDAPAEPVDESLQGLSLGHASSGRASSGRGDHESHPRRRGLRRPPAAAVLDRLPDARRRRGGGGHRAGGVPALPAG